MLGGVATGEEVVPWTGFVGLLVADGLAVVGCIDG